MRKIESQMCQAVQQNINWKNANTEVTIDKETNTSSVYLHGNLIATVTDNDMTIYDGGCIICHHKIQTQCTLH